MENFTAFQLRKRVLFGLTFVIFGVACFLEQIGSINAVLVWDYLPLLLVLMGLNRFYSFDTAHEITNGALMIFVGFWLFACVREILGLTFGSSWPLLVIAVGVRLSAEPLINWYLNSDKEQGRE